MLGKVSSSFSDMDLLLVKAEGIQKGCVTLEKVSYQHELLYVVLHEGMREVPQEVWRGLAPCGEFQKGSVALGENLSYQHELMYEILRVAMQEVPHEVRRDLAPRVEFIIVLRRQFVFSECQGHPEGLRDAREGLVPARALIGGSRAPWSSRRISPISASSCT